MTINTVFWATTALLWLAICLYFFGHFLFRRPRGLLNLVWVLATTQGVALPLTQLRVLGPLGAAVVAMGGFAAGVLAWVLVYNYESQSRR